MENGTDNTEEEGNGVKKRVAGARWQRGRGKRKARPFFSQQIPIPFTHVLPRPGHLSPVLPPWRKLEVSFAKGAGRGKKGKGRREEKEGLREIK